MKCLCRALGGDGGGVVTAFWLVRMNDLRTSSSRLVWGGSKHGTAKLQIFLSNLFDVSQSAAVVL